MVGVVSRTFGLGGRGARGALAVAVAIALTSCSASSGSPPAAVATGAAAASPTAGPPLNVGLIAALTGPFAANGTSKLEGAKAAVEEINQAGGILGRPVSITTVDTKNDPVDAVPAARQMLATDNVSLVLGFSVTDYQNALPIVNAAKMVSFTYIGSPSIDHTLFQYSFRMQPSDAVVGAAMAYYAKQKGYKTLALVFDAAEGAQDLIPPIEAAAKTLGLTIVAKPSVPVNVTSYEGEILQVIRAKPDAMLMQLQPQEAGTFFSQLEGLGGQAIPIVGSDLTAAPEWIKAIGAARAARQLVSIIPSSGESGPSGQTFLATYQRLFNHPPRTFSSHFYDAMNVAALAMVAAKSTDPQVYVNSISDVTTPGPDHTVVYNYADGIKLLAQGKKIKYFGAGSPMIFNQFHDVTGSFEAIQASADGKTSVLGNIAGDALVDLLK
ncbi:MAG TPA: ABC transporter substrate-binding protein [Candidatus Limnocylindria bacterium]|nr:ABC transporter substrate-binding protein [Candidatus Limnocylindria bacterium]